MEQDFFDFDKYCLIKEHGSIKEIIIQQQVIGLEFLRGGVF